MNKKYFALLGFLFLFFTVFSLGCNFGGGKGSELVKGGESAVESASVTKGPLNASILVNGRPSLTIDLISEQNAQIGLQVTNTGNLKMSNFSAMLIGCLDTRSSPLVFEDSLDMNERRYISWDVKALKMSSSERITCYQAIRVCFDSEYVAYSDLIIVPEVYQEAPAIPSSYSSSNLLATDFKFGVIRVLTNTDNIINGAITLKNAVPGWVGYINYSGINEGLNINMLRSITIQTSDSRLKFVKIGELNVASMPNTWKNSDNTRLTFYFKDTSIGSDNYAYFLRMIGGRELNMAVGLNITDASYYQSAPKIERINMTVNHGYCIDLASITVSMRGR